MQLASRYITGDFLFHLKISVFLQFHNIFTSCLHLLHSIVFKVYRHDHEYPINYRRHRMSAHEKQHQTQEAEIHFEQMMKQIEAIDPDNLYAIVPGSQLHQHISNPGLKPGDTE